MKKSAKSKTENSEGIPSEIKPLIYDGLNQLLSRPGLDYTHRDWNKKPLTHDEELFLITTLNQELEDPTLPGGLLFLYGRILEFITENIVYN
jgi:hypothetical protein